VKLGKKRLVEEICAKFKGSVDVDDKWLCGSTLGALAGARPEHKDSRSEKSR
jgi:hypothetical protein